MKAVIDEYRAQGRELTEAEAEKIREQLRQAIAQGHMDARDDVLGDDVLEKIAAGAGGAPFPTFSSRHGDGGDPIEYGCRQ